MVFDRPSSAPPTTQSLSFMIDHPKDPYPLYEDHSTVPVADLAKALVQKIKGFGRLGDGATPETPCSLCICLCVVTYSCPFIRTNFCGIVSSHTVV